MPGRRTPARPTKSARIRQLDAAGVGRDDIARRLRVSRATIRSVLRSRAGGPPRPVGRPAREVAYEPMLIRVAPHVAAWLRHRAEREGSTLGDVVAGFAPARLRR